MHMKPLILLILALMLSGCQPKYRYDCQNPNNFYKKECNDETCKVDGTCTENVLGKELENEIKKKS